MNFNQLIQVSVKPVVANFFATWCGPCKMFAPIFEATKEKCPQFEFVKLDIDVSQNEELATQYGVTSVPTTILFQNGQIIAQKAGTFPTPELFEKWIKQG